MMSLGSWKLAHKTVTDALLQEWHHLAMKGDVDAFERLLLWVYSEANYYYFIKSKEVQALSRHDAEDLASEFVLDFQAVWKDIRSVSHYTRYVLKKNLQRHLSAHGKRGVVVPLAFVETTSHAVTQVHTAWTDWSDQGYLAYTVFCDEFFSLPAPDRLLIQARLQQPPTPFAAVCSRLGLSEDGARVQTSRFFRRIRKRCLRLFGSHQ